MDKLKRSLLRTTFSPTRSKISSAISLNPKQYQNSFCQQRGTGEADGNPTSGKKTWKT